MQHICGCMMAEPLPGRALGGFRQVSCEPLSRLVRPAFNACCGTDRSQVTTNCPVPGAKQSHTKSTCTSCSTALKWPPFLSVDNTDS